MPNKLSIIFIFVFVSKLANAEQSSIKQLESFLSSTTSLTAEFKQVTLSENGQPGKTSYGVFYLSRPGKFRWNYSKPFVQEIVSNKGKVWFYDADLEQVTIKQIDDSVGSTPALLLSGDVALKENYILKKQGVDEGLQWVKLSPKNEDSGFNYMLIGLDKKGLAGMELKDNFGQLTRIYFSKVKKNIKLDDKLFEFTAPKGVDIFEN
jgi:outer membrane lipoprotein carrier protein